MIGVARANSHRRMERGTGRSRPRGFTLLEVLVALVVSGVVVLGVRGIVSVVAEASERTKGVAEAADADANGDRVLRSLVYQLMSGEGRHTFSGTADEARFTSWCSVSAGWLERCRVALSTDSIAGAVAVVAKLSTGESLVLRRGLADARIEYLAAGGEGGTWIRTWGAGTAIPEAIVLIVRAAADTAVAYDTIIVRTATRQ